MGLLLQFSMNLCIDILGCILVCLTPSYAVSISSTLFYDISPHSNPFAGFSYNEWRFTTQPGPIITNSTLKLDSSSGLGSTTLVLSSTKAGTVIQFRGVRLMDFGTPTVTYGPYGCGYTIILMWLCLECLNRPRVFFFLTSTYSQHKYFILCPYVSVSSRPALRPYYDVPWRLE